MKQLNPHSSDGDAAHEDFEQVTAKAFDFALAVVGHELGAAERLQAMAFLGCVQGRDLPCQVVVAGPGDELVEPFRQGT
ncbi:MAG TPA: hypothetical protein VJ625_14310 [Propionibacteriaceae bacterium]|nr:hypothetical protein [Propionibacteriaceae bacterium]